MHGSVLQRENCILSCAFGLEILEVSADRFQQSNPHGQKLSLAAATESTTDVFLHCFPQDITREAGGLEVLAKRD